MVRHEIYAADSVHIMIVSKYVQELIWLIHMGFLNIFNNEMND